MRYEVSYSDIKTVAKVDPTYYEDHGEHPKQQPGPGGTVVIRPAAHASPPLEADKVQRTSADFQKAMTSKGLMLIFHVYQQ
jgi:hypothetical protein